MLDTTAKLDMVTDGTDPDSDAYRCRMVWLVVIEQAIYDSTRKPQNLSMDRDREDAIRWLSEGRKDFRFVCEMAGIDPDWLHEAYTSGRLDIVRYRSVDAAEAKARKRKLEARRVAANRLAARMAAE